MTEATTQAKTWDEVTATNTKFRRLAKWSGIPINTWQTHRLFNFVQRKGVQRAYQAALDFVSGKSGHHFLTLVGEPGTGKTHLALGMGWHWLENDMGLVKYYEAESLLDDLRRGFSVSDPERAYSFDQLMKWLKEVDLLILDDLGVEKPTEWAAAKLDEIVDHRYIHGGRTVMTTNLDPAAFGARGEARLASRLTEGVIEILECDDYRGIKAKAKRNPKLHQSDAK